MEAETPLLEGGRLHNLIAHSQSEVPTFPRTPTTGTAPAQDAQALARLGVRLCLQEKHTEALTALRAATELAPTDHRILNNLAVVLERAHRLPDAIDAARRSLALHHPQPDVWLHLANMLKSQNDPAAAERAYRTALTLEPTSPIAWQMLGLLHQENRRFKDAIDCFLHCARNGNASARGGAIFSILGQLFHQTGNFEKSLHAYTAAADLEPNNPTYADMRRRVAFLVDLINLPSVDEALTRYLASLPTNAPEESRNLDTLLQTAFSLLSGYGHTAAAQRVGQKRLALHPQSPSAAYLLKALAGDQSLPRSPDDYLVEYFDAFADGFDHQLTGLLGYDVPRQLADLVRPHLPNRKIDILDVGCGTGLCGLHIAPHAQTLTGVDLSPKMLELARQRNLYHHLFCHEITDFLYTSSARADLLLAADVLIYFGDLAPLFEGFTRALNPGGILALSIEHTDGQPHRLLPSGRFAHDPQHVRTIAAQNGLHELTSRNTTLRLEAATPVPGQLLAFYLPD